MARETSQTKPTDRAFDSLHRRTCAGREPASERTCVRLVMAMQHPSKLSRFRMKQPFPNVSWCRAVCDFAAATAHSSSRKTLKRCRSSMEPSCDGLNRFIETRPGTHWFWSMLGGPCLTPLSALPSSLTSPGLQARSLAHPRLDLTLRLLDLLANRPKQKPREREKRKASGGISGISS